MPLPDLNSIPTSGKKEEKDNEFEEIQYEDLDGLEEITDESLDDDSATISDYNNLDDLEEITDENLEEENDLVGLDDFPEISLDDLDEENDEEVSLQEQEVEIEDDESDEEPMFSMGEGLASKFKFKNKEKKEKTKSENPLFKFKKEPKEKKPKTKSNFNLFKLLKMILMLLIAVVVVVFVLKFLGNKNSSDVTSNTEVSQDIQDNKKESATSGGLEIKNRTIQDNSYYLLIKSANPVTPKFVESAFLTDNGIIKCIVFSPQIEAGDNTVLLDDCDGDIYDGMKIEKAIDNIKIQ